MDRSWSGGAWWITLGIGSKNNLLLNVRKTKEMIVDLRRTRTATRPIKIYLHYRLCTITIYCYIV